MEKFVDLHLHSHCSDGLYAPTEVIRRAAEAGLAAAALADHDNVDGVEEAMQTGRTYGIEVLSSVELSVIWESYRDIHLLGYGIDHRHPGLTAALKEFRDFRAGRNERIVERINGKLAEEGRAPICFAEVQKHAEGTLGRPHIARVLIDHGYARNHEEAFARYLVPCNVAKRYFPMDEAIALIHDAGGITSLAHPPYITDDRQQLRHLFDVFTDMGLDGIEAYNNRSTNADIDWYITEARRRELIVTGGSDYHGVEGSDIVIGGGRGNLRIPYDCVEDIRRALARRAGKERV
ncbi:metal-dependent phosphoesterase, PHP family [Syntrophotalea carbinolica DSM 2380]|uniref:Metal-dependent phosphoesterase, PHP family n=1 Tax=Syntrophotalea carbinolica (strain DSM 2380 / NBRC 103641 / GraBd1) TaxID=338963 RepID=Q3A644_SYNC1|nr:PHP domain-containing protein [Syntrophotalea carbinolica]ABA88163.1 metal-dependent phosphoesterase, PHP family [Syntrophotalea carbinolica DSM 2380]